MGQWGLEDSEKRAKMKQLFHRSILSASLVAYAPAAFCSTEFIEVLKATRSILSGRCFENEDQTRLSFSALLNVTIMRSEIDVLISFREGQVASHREVINNVGGEVVVDQIVDGKIVGKYTATVEAPYNVLRLRPLNDSSSDFISRECVYQSSDQKNICYLKIRSENDVFVSAFREVPCS